MDFAKILNKALPWIGAAATGNVPALIGMAAQEVGAALGVKVDASADAIGKAVANATPEQMLALRTAEMAFQERMQAMNFADVADLRKVALEEARMYVGDVADARHAHRGDDKVFWLGIAVLAIFALTMGAALYGSFQILTGGITIKDVAVVAAVSGFVGSIVGYVAANAQQVIAYFFGSSKGSSDKTNALAAAAKDLTALKR